MPDFPHPLSVETPHGCEGWEEMYPYWALFDERRRESDENRLWFWNSQHFPFPMPAFDMVEVDHPYYTLGGWQNRAFAVPPAMGVDYRVVNGYVYISPNPVTDPDKIAERAEYFEKRAGHYFQNWDELYAGWRDKMEALNREVEAIDGARPARVRARRGRVRRAEPQQHRPAAGLLAHAPLRGDDVAAPLRVPAARLRRLPHVRRVPAERAAGHPRAAHLADGGRHRRGAVPRRHRAAPAGAPRHRHGRGRRVRGGPHARTRSTPRCPRATRAAAGSRSSRRSRTPGSTWAPATASTTTTAAGTTTRSIPYASLVGHIAALKAGKEIERPTEELAKERDRLAEEYGALLDEEARPAFQELLGLSRTVFPYVEEHKFYCDYWFQSRFFNKVREFGALLAKHGFLGEARTSSSSPATR